MSDITALPEWVQGNRDEIVADLTEYVRQETPSDDKALLTSGLVWVEDWLTTRLGAADGRRIEDGGEYADTAVLEYLATDTGSGSATGTGTGSGGWVTALCHYDTVWPAGTGSEWAPAIDGDRFTGPGAFDMKGGLVQLVWALKAGEALGLPRPNLRLVLNGDEEVGSLASRAVIEQEVVRGSAVLVFEASANGAVKTARKGVGIFHIDVRGEAVHAGLDPEAGASAIDELARIVLALHDATDLDNGTSVNVGVIHGGTRTNVKAGSARADVDVRVASDAEARRIDAVFAGLAPHNPKAAITVSGGWNRPVMTRSEGAVDLFTMASGVANELGFTLDEISVGGASDGNFAAALGLAVLDGLGAVGEGAHARHEWISIDGMLQRTALAAGVLAKLAEKNAG